MNYGQKQTYILNYLLWKSCVTVSVWFFPQDDLVTVIVVPLALPRNVKTVGIISVQERANLDSGMTLPGRRHSACFTPVLSPRTR